MAEQETSYTISVEQANKLKEECNKRVKLAEALARLENLPDYKMVFEEEYSKNEPSRLVSLLAEPTFNNSDKKEFYRNDIKERMVGIARFTEFTRNVYMLADQAKKTLEDLSNAETI